MAGWNGLSLGVASRILATFDIKITKNEEEGCIVATHPRTNEDIRRATVTACVQAALENWLTMK